MSAFRVGQRVVCVDDSIRREWYVAGKKYNGNLNGLTKGAVYTVRDVLFDELHGQSAIRLVEIQRPDNRFNGKVWEAAYHPARFRPVSYPKQSQSTDIALIKSMIKTVKVDA